MSEATDVRPTTTPARRDALGHGCATATLIVPLLSVGELSLLSYALDINFDSAMSFLIVVLYPYLCIFQGIALGIAVGALIRRRDIRNHPDATPAPANPPLLRWFLLGGATSTAVAVLIALLF